MSQTPTTAAAPIRLADVAPNRRRGGDIRVLLSPGTAGSTSGFLGVLTLATGEYVSEHYHPYSEEFLYLVSGAIVAVLDGEAVPVAAGEALLVPIGVRHRIVNSGDGPAFAVFHLSPLAPEPRLGHVDTEPLPNPEVPHFVGAQAEPGFGGAEHPQRDPEMGDR